MRILVTNDDGIDCEGVQVLVRHLARTAHEIVVVAPDRDYSGSGASLGVLHPDSALDVQKVVIDGAEDVEAWALAGPPALTVVAARLGAFGEPPDLVVSGINVGCNTGRSILHSGTVGAVLAAQNFGISGLAVSVAVSDPMHWDSAAAFAVEVLPLVITGPARSAVNLNVPARPRSEIPGVKWARLAPFGAVRTTIVASDESRLRFELEPTGVTPEPDTDQGVVDDGWAALTALVGVVEAWPEVPAPVVSRDVGEEPTYVPHLAPGSELHPVHVVPDGSDHRLLRRPVLGD